ncbi:MAG: hypothetical protein AUG45_11440 [Ktedonobacter sp. 13_1_20CM_3_54_15]|jgi:hypothetical protein|nr:MAG: hypothetical protein AUG45_11440 [Ktedonobacter sp. 13_1_20CM_3_54_15]
MQYTQQFTYVDKEIAYDDIDILFSQLQPIEPPHSIVARILSRVKGQAIDGRIPSHPLAWQMLDGSLERGMRRAH